MPMRPVTAGAEPGRLARLPGARWIGWAVAHGLPRRMLRRAARRGDLIARLEVDPELRENPYPGFDELRERSVVVGGHLLMATANHAASHEILRSDAFGVAGGQGELPAPLRKLVHATGNPLHLGPLDPPSLLAVDPPVHNRYRKLVARIFTPRAVMALEPRMREIADSLLDELGNEVDLIEQYAAQLPLQIICEMLGVPDEMNASLLGWGNGAARLLDPGLSWADYKSATEDMAQLHVWFNEHVAHLRTDPGDDLFSKLVSLDGEDRLSDLELAATGLLVLAAGFETTVNLIGSAVVLLDQHPDQLALALEDSDRWGNVVEEVLRYESPVQLTMRMAYQDTEVRGVHIPKNQPVLIMLAGANRDPEVFADPHRFDVLRPNAAEHLAFSSGVHYCLGPSLARMEARVALEALYDRFGDLTISGTPQRRDNRVLRGYTTVPITTSSRHVVNSGGENR